MHTDQNEKYALKQNSIWAPLFSVGEIPTQVFFQQIRKMKQKNTGKMHRKKSSW